MLKIYFLKYVSQLPNCQILVTICVADFYYNIVIKYKFEHYQAIKSGTCRFKKDTYLITHTPYEHL